MKYSLNHEQLKRIIQYIREESLKVSQLHFEIAKEDEKLSRVEDIIDEIEEELELLSERLMKHEDVSRLVHLEETLIKRNVREWVLLSPVFYLISNYVASGVAGANKILVTTSALVSSLLLYAAKIWIEKIRLNEIKWDIADRHDVLFEQIRNKNGERKHAYTILSQVEKQMELLQNQKYEIDFRMQKLIEVQTILTLLQGEVVLEIDPDIKNALDSVQYDSNEIIKERTRKIR